jgi:hypothetical protein
MSDRAWKQAERAAAALIAGTRHWANSGEEIDVESAGVIAQVKHRRVCSLAELERLAREAERQGTQRDKLGLVLVKRRAGRGVETPWLVVMTAATYREMSGPLPGELPAG